jgi:subtilase family serine protease
VYFASTGDAPGTQYPSVSPNVVAAGGTTVNRDATTHAYLSESAWADTGGGPSKYEPIPSYQSVISGIVGTARGVPDFASDADPNSGVWVYATNVQGTGWYVFGGTSVSSPTLAGIVNSTKSFASSSSAELTTLYSNLGNGSYFRDIKGGTCGTGGKYKSVKGWDYCTGVGSDNGKKGK